MIFSERDAISQELEIAVSPSPVGSGARAAGMADAFVAIADDATASSWNPAGLVQLEHPEISIVGSYNAIYERFGAAYHPEFDSEHRDRNFDLNYLSVVYPLPFLVIGRNASVSVSYQRKYDFSRSFDAELNTSRASRLGTPLNDFLDFEFEQEGGLSTVTSTFAMELTHRLSLGVAVNCWRSTLFAENGWEQRIRRRVFSLVGPIPVISTGTTNERYEDFEGENFSAGLLWNPLDKWSFGARYDTAFTGEAKYKRTGSVVSVWGSTLNVFPDFDRDTREVRFPASCAFGAAYRHSDRLTFSFDATRTDWNDFYFKDRNGNRFSLVDASNLDQVIFRSHFDPTYTFRFGTEYVFVPEQPDETLNRLWTVRGGLFYDQEPATGNPDNFYGFAVGMGLLARQRVNIDLAYQLRYGRSVNADFIRGVPGFDEDVVQHRVLVSTVIYLRPNRGRRPAG